MEQTPLVSVIVPTKNSAETLERCLASIRMQSYSAIELIVVDNFSTDSTQEVAGRFADHIYTKGPERSTQRNSGVRHTRGTYVAIIDSDMELTPHVIEECVARMKDSKVAGVVIPEESIGEGFWAQCKQLERRFYLGVPWMEAARFFRKDAFLEEGGYNEALVSGEDWDLSQRMGNKGALARTRAYIYHHEGHIRLFTTIKKKYYYAKHLSRYTATKASAIKEQMSILGRFRLFFSKPGLLFRDPILGIGMLVMKTCEFGAGAVGYAQVKLYEYI